MTKDKPEIKVGDLVMGSLVAGRNYRENTGLVLDRHEALGLRDDEVVELIEVLWAGGRRTKTLPVYLQHV